MAQTRPATGLSVERWDNEYTSEYFQQNPFTPVMGTGPNSIIQVKEDFEKAKGKSMTLALVGRVADDDGVEGSDLLEGNEEGMDTRSFTFNINKRRKGVTFAEIDEFDVAINLREAAKDVLMDWSQESTKSRILKALGSIDGTSYASASETAKDTWLASNSDRVLFGASTANNSGNDHSASLANIDTADALSPTSLSLMKRLALAKRTTAGKRKVAPIRVAGENRRYFKVYAGPRTFRDLANNTTIQEAQRQVQLTKENNRLFQGGDLYWNGMIIHEVDDIEPITGVGDSGIDVEPVYLCGAQALVYGIGRRWRTKTKTFDYGDKYGVAVEEICGIHKCRYGSGVDDLDDPVDHGVVTGYFAAAAD